MWRLLRKLAKRLFAAVGAVAIVLAIGIGAFRLLITQLPSYQGEIQGWAREALGLSVDFTALDARLGLLGPELTFHDARVSRVGDESRPIVSATEARLGLNALALFSRLELEVSRLTLQGARLAFERTANGALRLQHAARDDADPAFALEDLPPVVIVMSDSNVIYEDRARQGRWEFQDVRLELTRTMDQVLLEARASAPERLGGRVELSAEATLLDAQGAADRSWRLFAEVRDLDLTALSTLVPEPLPLPLGGLGDVSLWLDVEGMRPNQGTLQISLSDLALLDGEAEGDGYEALALTAEWARLEEGFSLSINNLELSRRGRSWPAGASLGMRVLRDDGALRALQLNAAFVRFDDLAPLVSLLPNTEATRLWTALAPQGEIADVELSLARDASGVWEYAGAGVFEQVGVRGYGEWPGIANVSGEVRADSRSGRLALSTRDARFDWPTLFPEPLLAAELDGILVWRRGRDGLRLVSDDLVLSNGDAHTRTTLELTVPTDGSSPILELESRVSDFDIGSTARYLPAGIMSPGVFAYLERAILGGRVREADVAFFGPIRAFPFDDGEGQFEAHLVVENGSMAYVETWPEALDLTGTIDFRNAGWVAEGAGRILGNVTERLRVGIEDLRDPLLTVAAQTTGPLGDVMRFLNEAPLIARNLGPDLARLQAGGGLGRVTFDLGLPLLDRASYTLDAVLEVVDGEVSVQGFAPTASDINGLLTLADGALSAEGIEATLLEGPVTVGVSPPEEPGYLATILFDGEIDVDAVHANLDLPLEGHFAGQTRWQGTLMLPATTYTQARREPLRISVGSNLSGVALRLPEPLSKSPDEPTSFQMDFVFSESDRLDVTGYIGAARRFALSFRNRDGELSFRRGSVRFGGDYPLLPPRDGLTVNGTLSQLHLEEWWPLLDRQISAGTVPALLLGSDLDIADFSAFGQHLGATELALRQEATQWRLEVQSEPVAGTVIVPLNLADRPQLVANMARLNISTADVGAATNERDPRDLPGLLVEADEFGVGQRRFGALSANIQADPLGLRMVSFQTLSESFAVEGSGGWFDDPAGAASRLALTLSSRDVAATLEALGLDPITEAEVGDVSLSVYWPGPPSTDWTQSISGDLTLRLERGSVLNLEPGAGRMMGLMSITALPRRLALDFRDVFNRGLVFDEVHGDFLIIDGNAFTDNLHLTGPVADIGVVGRTGLRDQDYEQQAVVTAEPGKILPTMGFLAGPQIGAALLIFTQIFKEPLKGIGRASYCVTGSWYEPAVERLTPAELHAGKLCADLPPGADVAQP